MSRRDASGTSRERRPPRFPDALDAAIARAETILASVDWLLAQRLAVGFATERTRELRRSAAADLAFLLETRRQEPSGRPVTGHLPDDGA